MQPREDLKNNIFYYYENGNFHEAKNQLKQYISLYEEDVQLLMLLAFCELDEGNFDKAFDCASRISVYYRNIKIAHFILGSIAWKKRDLNEALRSFKVAIKNGLPKEFIAEVTNNELNL
jgi:tetratricopeptide (TPR) repeat protein